MRTTTTAGAACAAREMGVALDGYDGDEKRDGPKRGRRKKDK
jgi:hypothetical protein